MITLPSDVRNENLYLRQEYKDYLSLSTTNKVSRSVHRRMLISR